MGWAEHRMRELKRDDRRMVEVEGRGGEEKEARYRRKEGRSVVVVEREGTREEA